MSWSFLDKISNFFKKGEIASEASASECIEKGKELFNVQNFKAALNCYNRATEIEPQNEKAWLGKAFALMGLVQLSEAIDCLDHLLKLNPRNVEAWVNKASVLKGFQREEESIKCSERALDIDPNHRTAWHNKGMSLYFLGRYRDALPCLEQAQILGFPTAKEAVVMCRRALERSKT